MSSSRRRWREADKLALIQSAAQAGLEEDLLDPNWKPEESEIPFHRVGSSLYEQAKYIRKRCPIDSFHTTDDSSLSNSVGGETQQGEKP